MTYRRSCESHATNLLPGSLLRHRPRDLNLGSVEACQAAHELTDSQESTLRQHDFYPLKDNMQPALNLNKAIRSLQTLMPWQSKHFKEPPNPQGCFNPPHKTLSPVFYFNEEIFLLDAAGF